MKTLQRIGAIAARWHLLFILGPIILFFLMSGFMGPAVAETCIPDETPPAININLPPTTDPYTGCYETTGHSVDLKGDVFDERGVTFMMWENDVHSGMATVEVTDWDAPWPWEARSIPLVEGQNWIAIIASDAWGNNGLAVFCVNRVLPPPPPPDVKNIDLRKAKFTFYFGGPSYEGLDRFSIVGYTAKESTEDWLLPFDEDVTVTVTAPDPNDASNELQLFTQTIPAGTVAGTTKYRYTGQPGIRDLTFMKSTSLQTYMYVYVENTDLLPDERSVMTGEEYQNYVRAITSYKITVQAGEKEWAATGTLVPGTYSEHKQEMVFNR